jgi:hypothetical protein
MCKAHPRMEVAILSRRLGRPEPQLEIRLPHGSNHRVVKAELHKLAAILELATPVGESWVVHIEVFRLSSRFSGCILANEIPGRDSCLNSRA